jgi:hypothetical protein
MDTATTQQPPSPNGAGVIASDLGAFPFAGECQAAFRTLQEWKGKLLDLAVDNPAETLFVVLTGGALVFYLAEREVNEGINTYDDALYYISTCLSVGYANVFPLTQTGKLVAAIVMAIGPALAAWQLEGRLVARQAQTPTPPDPIVERLDQILAELRSGKC